MPRSARKLSLLSSGRGRGFLSLGSRGSDGGRYSRFHWDFRPNTPHSACTRREAPRRRPDPRLDRVEPHARRASGMPPEILGACPGHRARLSIIQLPAGSILRPGKRWRLITRGSGYRGRAIQRVLLTASTRKPTPISSNCWATRATTCWCRALRIRFSIFSRPWNLSRCARIPWSMTARGASISTAPPPRLTARTRAIVLRDPYRTIPPVRL